MTRANRIGWVVALFSALILLSTFATTSTNDYASGSTRSERRADVVECDRKSWSKYVGINDSRVLARVDVKMRACWKTAAAAVDPGKVIDSDTTLDVDFYNTGWGDTSGANWNLMEKWQPDWYPWDTFWSHTKMQHIGFRSCLVAGQLVCTPTADFSVGGKFTSPYLIKRSDGSVDRWDFVFFEGEPGKEPGSFDKGIWICNEMCR
jgi:hypothetical protein